MPKQERKRIYSQAAEGSDQGRTTGFKKTIISDIHFNENLPTTSHKTEQRKSMEETFSPRDNFENTYTQNHFEDIVDSTKENLETSSPSSPLFEESDEDENEMSEEESKHVHASVSESVIRADVLPSDKGANFLKLFYFICSLVTKAARTWFMSKYPKQKLKKKQKKLKNLMGNDNNKTFLQRSDEGIMVIYDELDISAIACLSRSLDTNSEWKKELQVNDHSDTAELRRIQEIRNKIAHNNVGEVDEADFRKMWETLEKAVSRLSKGKLDKHFLEYRRLDLLERRLPGVQIQRSIPTETINDDQSDDGYDKDEENDDQSNGGFINDEEDRHNKDLRDYIDNDTSATDDDDDNEEKDDKGNNKEDDDLSDDRYDINERDDIQSDDGNVINEEDECQSHNGYDKSEGDDDQSNNEYDKNEDDYDQSDGECDNNKDDYQSDDGYDEDKENNDQSNGGFDKDEE
ncbi:protein PFC0760c-like [Saccostrea cucullata]|uniref:protein PFC0760c-like n=1 Tax=Saccostrea cuccullata TaxID=36930 RepID=UPI002ED2ADED